MTKEITHACSDHWVVLLTKPTAAAQPPALAAPMVYPSQSTSSVSPWLGMSPEPSRMSAQHDTAQHSIAARQPDSAT
jgi:hypothetical protein